MTTLTFSDAEVPTRSNAGPNPFTEIVGQLKGTDTAKAFTLPGTDDEKTNEELRTAVRQLRKSGEDADVTVRLKKEVGGTKKEPTVKVTFWTVPRITRKPSDKGSDNSTDNTDTTPTSDTGVKEVNDGQAIADEVAASA